MNKPVIRKVLIKVVRILLMSYVGMLAVAYFMQQKLVWPMSLETPVHRSAHPAARLVWMNQHEDKPELAVEGWFFPAPGASAEKPAPALIFFHGNNEVIDYCLEFVETYSRMGISVLLAEYRGYGRSGGTPVKWKFVRIWSVFTSGSLSSLTLIQKELSITVVQSVGEWRQIWLPFESLRRWF